MKMPDALAQLPAVLGGTALLLLHVFPIFGIDGAQVNTQGFQNRLRHSDYRALLEQAGFRIVLAQGMPDSHCLAALRTLPLAARFRDKPAEDLAVLTSLFVATKPETAGA